MNFLSTTIFFLSMVSMCFSCKGHGAERGIIGETVSSLDTSIWYIFQDRHNNYWFGSDGNGVYRYDGKNTLHYTTRHGLCNDRVRGIQEDSSGNIYINTCNGISKFDGQAFTTLRAITSPGDDGGWRLHSGDLWFQGPQDSGVLYRYDGRTLYRLRFPKVPVAEEFTATHPRSKFPNMVFSPYDIYSIYMDRRGVLWFGTGMLGVCRYDGVTHFWITERELGLDSIAYGVRSTIEDKYGKFWFSRTLHSFDIHRNTGGRISYTEGNGMGDIGSSGSVDHSYFLSSLEDNNGDMWVVTYNKGIWRYDGKSMIQYRIKDKDGQYATTFTIYKDRSGGLWLGTHAAGAYKFNGVSFEPFRP